MTRRIWFSVETFNSKDDFDLFIERNNVSRFRTEEMKSAKKITYRCVSRRKFPECDYQIRAILSSDNDISVFSSNSHDHSIRAQTTRAPSPVREIVVKSTAAKLTATQTRLAVGNEYQGQVPSSQLSSLLKYQRSITRPSVYSVDDFRTWCQQRSSAPSLQSMNDVFVPEFEINSSDEIFVFFTTRQLISVSVLSPVLQVDATFKLTWNELPLLVFGSSDADRHFHPYGVALISTDEAAESYSRLFQAIKKTVVNTTGIVYDVKYLMGDGGKGITSAAKTDFPNARRLMCWFHVVKNCREHRRMVPAEQWPAVDQNICTVQLSFSDAVFSKAVSLLLQKWKAQRELIAFANYFETQWLNALPFWYEGAAPGVPSTNNGLESLNGKIKQNYTLRNKLVLPVFLSTIEQMLLDWSVQSVERGFRTFPTISPLHEKDGYQWIENLEKKQLLYWYGHAYVVPSSSPVHMPPHIWLQQLTTLPWQTFDDFCTWLYAGRLVSIPMMCSCKQNLKQYVCKHALGLMMYFGYHTVTDPSRFQKLGKRQTGRPKKVKTALMH